ncbi:hypothetical protein PSAL_015920 [Pseudooceanicola algae]|uniref:DUF952 domain-containing protein n=2 Tax=Pseudooceanicola algae TaxID=1537215 RepID=A0A418SHB6_9RHOB|nr:hypothetical protein PSAL_015920 [Pseudooceanicola algae]
MIYKIFRKTEWDELVAQGETAGAPIDLEDGYIHFSSADTVAETAALHFKDQDELILAACDPEAMEADLKWESSRGGKQFPHLYRKLRMEDVSSHWALPLSGGRHLFPDGLL